MHLEGAEFEFTPGHKLPEWDLMAFLKTSKPSSHDDLFTSTNYLLVFEHYIVCITASLNRLQLQMIGRKNKVRGF